MVERSPQLRRLLLAVAAAGQPLSLDALAGSRLWRVSELWSLVEDARREGLLEPDASGCLQWSAPGGPSGVLGAASTEDFAALTASEPMRAVLLEGARSAVRGWDLDRAMPLYAGLVAAPDLPGALRATVVLESLRAFRSTWAASAEGIDAALAWAVSQGDLRTQAVLLAARGLQWADANLPRARELFARAAEAAEAVGDEAVRAEVRTYAAVSFVLAGRLREGIAAFEQMVGNVPSGGLDAEFGVPLDLDGVAPAAALGMLAGAYVNTGDHPRALDLLHRLRVRGAELGHPALEAQAHTFLAGAYLTLGDAEAARPHAEAARRYWTGTTRSAWAWYAALSLAYVRRAQGDLAGAGELIAGAVPGWERVGRPWVGGSRSMELFAALEDAGLCPIAIDEELDRHAAEGKPFHAGMAHRLLARRVLSLGGEARDERAAEHLARALELLREAGARPELRLALADAAALADARQRRADRSRYQAELAEIAPAAPLPGSAHHLLPAVLELGRLGALAGQNEGVWGEIAARLCRDFGAERCAIVESGEDGPVLLAARGPGPWREALLERLRRAAPLKPEYVAALPEPGSGERSGQLVLVPFADEAFGRRGCLALENRRVTPAIGVADEPVLRALGRQIPILLANVALWRELSDARRRLEQENRYYREAAPTLSTSGRLVGDSPAMRGVLELVRRVAPAATPVLVTGETGSGKEVVARELHHQSPRRDGPFIAVHVAALSPGLVPSALFGHERGAFTGATEQVRGRFELADGGTLFLDEVGELSAEDQVRLLRVLQEGTFERVGGTRTLRSDFRLVAATHRDLAAEVRAGRFREDLYFRLAAFPTRVPPLRERREEIPTLALYFMERIGRKLGLRFEGIVEADMARLVAHAWPGNVRELEHVVERAALLSDPPRLRIPALEGPIVTRSAPSPGRLAPGDWPTLSEVERRYVRDVLVHTRGRITGAGGAAELLGLNPSTLRFRIEKLGLGPDLARARG